MLAAVLILGLYFIPERLTVGFVGVGHLIQLASWQGWYWADFPISAAGRGWAHERSDAGDGGGQRHVRGHGGQLRHHGAGHALRAGMYLEGCGPEGGHQQHGSQQHAVFLYQSLFPAFYMMKDMNPRGKVGVCSLFRGKHRCGGAICPGDSRKSQISLSPCLSGK